MVLARLLVKGQHQSELTKVIEEQRGEGDGREKQWMPVLHRHVTGRKHA